MSDAQTENIHHGDTEITEKFERKTSVPSVSPW